MRWDFLSGRVGVLVAVGATVVLASPPIDAGQHSIPANPDRATLEHVLSRVSFGARPGDVDRLRAIGIADYLDGQLHPERIADEAVESRLASFETLTLSSGELAARYFVPAMEARRAQQQRAGQQPQQAPSAQPPEAPRRMPGAPASDSPREVLAELMQARMLRAALSERQLQEVLTDFWFNHFNVFIGKGAVRQYLTEYERDAIRPNVLGHFRTLLGAVAHSPAMLFYLDNVQSAAPNPRLLMRQGAARGLNENYARELMELHTLGVEGGYSQKDVTELARILTGWTIDQPRFGGRFIFRPALHDNGTKQLLGTTFHADGEREGERALDLLARHPSTARHIAYQLSQRFVADDPPQALVTRAASVFLETHGDLREVTRAILTSPEFFAPATRRGQVKTPLEFVTSAVRATGATVRSAQPLVTALRNLGMPLYECQPPTGYSTTADAWVNTGSLLSRMNTAVELVSGGRVLPLNLSARGQDAARMTDAADTNAPFRGRGQGGGAARMRFAPIAIDIAGFAPDTSAASRAAVVDRLLAGTASETTARTLARADTPEQLLALALGSPEFQRR